MYKVIDGKKLADEIIATITQQIIDEGLEPNLAVILVGNDPASHTYVRLKEQACRNAGIVFNKYLLDEDATEERIIETVEFLNKDSDIDAILIQLPLPKHCDQQKIINALDYRKDVDGFHPKNLESFLSGKKQMILPGLSLAIWNLVATAEEKNYLGKHVLLVGRSEAFTKPTKKVLEDQGMTCDIAAPTDPALATKTKAADILVTAIGRPNAITADMVKPGTIVIDVGINKFEGKTVGDIDFEHVAPLCSFITPVPGGVGPMTVAMLLFNTVVLARLKKNQ